jgi:CRP-like cAMP-binding protein
MQDFFSYCKKFDPKDFQTILSEGQLFRYNAGDCIYHQGDRSDCFYVLNEGSVEIIVAGEQGENPMPIVFLSKGDVFGEMGLLTGMPRNATARVPESAVVLKFPKIGFERLIFGVPSFAFYIACLLARRLNQTTVQLHFYSNARELAGSLDFFDLPTIFQTISLSQQHGLMEVRLITGEVLGEFAFALGKPIQARYRHLYGKEALYEFFQSTPKATFSFSRLTGPPMVEQPIELRDVNEFLMDAVHQRDELRALQEKMELDQPLGRSHAIFNWDGDRHLRDCAISVWEFLTDRRLSPRELYELLPFSQYTITRVVSRMLELDQLTAAKMTSYGYR